MKKYLIVILFFLSACTSDMNLDKFSNTQPKLLLEKYFNGKTEAWGLFHDRFGNLKRSFKVDISGTVSGNELILDERFLYDDGEKDQRIWKIKILGDNKYSGTAPDVVGEAIGESRGNALNWKYKLNLKVDQSIIKVDFDDWMFLQDKGVLMNRAEVRKWGINVGVVTITFLKIN